jgi:hypothetical protein
VAHRLPGVVPADETPDTAPAHVFLVASGYGGAGDPTTVQICDTLRVEARRSLAKDGAWCGMAWIVPGLHARRAGASSPRGGLASARRVEFLPVAWACSADAGTGPLEAEIAGLALGMQGQGQGEMKVRRLVHEVALEVMRQASPYGAQAAATRVIDTMQRLHAHFMDAYPGFAGKWMLLGHSLAGVAVFDALVGQDDTCAGMCHSMSPACSGCFRSWRHNTQPGPCRSHSASCYKPRRPAAAPEVKPMAVFGVCLSTLPTCARPMQHG